MHRPTLAHRSTVTLALALLGVLSSAPAHAGVSAEEQRRLVVQHQLDYDVPLVDATWIGTHNSFNNGDDGYRWPNQARDMTEQLDAGFRALSWDLYGANAFDDSNVVLCHGDHCSEFDTSVSEAGNDLEAWLDDNPGEVVLVVFEYDLTDQQEDAVGSDLDDTLGAYAYTPADYYGVDTGEACQQLPLTELTKRDVLDAGKQVVLLTAKEGSSACPDDGEWREYVWNVRTESEKGDYDSATQYTDRLGIAFEDESFFGSLTCYSVNPDWNDEACIRANELSNDELEEALTNGVHVIALDYAVTEDQHNSLIWSWKEDYPFTSSILGNCVLQDSDGKWINSSCSTSRHHACQSVLDGSWAVSPSPGDWYDGHEACAELGDEYVFAAPVNARMNAFLQLAKLTAGKTTVYLNASDLDSADDWVVHTVVDQTEYDGKKLVAGWDDGLCLNVVGNESSTNGASVNTYTCDGVDETWFYQPGDGTIRAHWDPSMCLNVVGNQSTTNGATVNLYDCDYVTESWEYSDSDLKIHASWDPSMCLNIVGNSSMTTWQSANLYSCASVTETWVWLE